MVKVHNVSTAMWLSALYAAALGVHWFYPATLPLAWAALIFAVHWSVSRRGFGAGIAAAVSGAVLGSWALAAPYYVFAKPHIADYFPLLAFVLGSAWLTVAQKLHEDDATDTLASVATSAAGSVDEDRLRSTLDAMLEGCQIIDSAYRYVYVNPTAASHGRREARELIGRTMMECFPGIENTELFQVIRMCVDSGRPQRMRNRFEYPGGTIGWFDLYLQPVPEGTLILSIDISSQMEAEEVLRRDEAHFRQLADSLPQLVWTCTPDGKCDYLGRQWIDYTGVSFDRQLGYGWIEQVHPDDRDALDRHWQQALQSHDDFALEFRIRRHDGVFRWFDTRAVRIRNAIGEVVKWVGCNVDIDDNRRAQESRLRVQKMEALGTLAGGIAHDFNNILLAIRGNTSLALQDLSAAHPARESMLEVDRASARAAELVNHILSFSRQQESRREVTQLRRVLAEALKLLRSTLPARIEIHSDLKADVPLVAADATQIYQVVMNLVTNAAHAIGDREGRIEVRLERFQIDEQIMEKLPHLQQGAYACMTVIDNGGGMSMETQQRIFDPFFTTKPVGEGTGLGLSVVDGIVKNHNGAIVVNSKLGVGTQFTLYFPAAGAVAPAVEKRFKSLQPTLDKSVLYVDDDEALVFLADRTLSRMGYRVACYTDPEVALQAFRQKPTEFDAIVTDLSMPKKSGFDVAREVLAVRASIPVIVTSGFVRPADHDTARDIGVRALILKPNTIEELGLALGELLPDADASSTLGSTQYESSQFESSRTGAADGQSELAADKRRSMRL